MGNPVSGADGLSRAGHPESHHLREDGLLQLWLAEVAVTHLICVDGSYFIGHSGGELTPSEPIGRLEPGQAALSEHLLQRIASTLTEIGFFDLGAAVDGRPLPRGALLPGSGPIEPLHLVYTARFDGQTNSVEVLGHPDLAWSVGPLEPLQQLLNDEVFGVWQRE